MASELYFCTHVGVVYLVDFSQNLWVGLTEIWHLREYHTEPLIDARRYWLLQSSLFQRTSECEDLLSDLLEVPCSPNIQCKTSFEQRCVSEIKCNFL